MKKMILILILLLNGCTISSKVTYDEEVFVVDDTYIESLRIKINPTELLELSRYPYPMVMNPDHIEIVVNKAVTLAEDYEPHDLVIPDVSHTAGNPKMLRKDAAEALEALFAQAKTHGHHLLAASGYRSYATQRSIYNTYVANHGEAAANTFSAKPGQSEHQLGLAMDYTSERFGNSITGLIANTPEGRWVSHNAHHFGFIVRYLQGKEHITGYIYEPWHLRYVGVELATNLYLCGCTMEEYYLMATPNKPEK